MSTMNATSYTQTHCSRPTPKDIHRVPLFLTPQEILEVLLRSNEVAVWLQAVEETA